MATIVVESGTVQAQGNFKTFVAAAGSNLLQGQLARFDSATDSWMVSTSDTKVGSVDVRLALCFAVAGQPVVLLRFGEVKLSSSSAVIPGQVYVVSGTDGLIETAETLASGQFMTTVGIGISTTSILFQVQTSGVAVA